MNRIRQPGRSRVDRSEYTGKRIGIMQPYFFPYLGYFGLIANTDRWIVADGVQYIRKGWMNRNRVLSIGGGIKYVHLTVASHRKATLIKDMRIREEADRFERFVRELEPYRLLRAPYYDTVLELIRDCFSLETDRLVAFLTRCLERTCRYLEIPIRYEVYSEMRLAHPRPEQSMEWALYICQAIGATEYLNPPGGRAIYDPQRFAEGGVRLLFHDQEFPAYDQRRSTFVPGLSIIDVMMFNAPDEIRDMLSHHTLSEL